jgi:heptosyltransferase-2
MTAHLQGKEHLLVRMPKWLGDCVMAEPALAALSDWWRSKGFIERMTVVGPAHFLGLWDGRFGSPLTGVNFVPSSDKVGVQSALRRAEVALLFTGSFRSAFEVWRAGVPRRVGWNRDLRGLFLTDTMKPMLERGGAPIVNTQAIPMSSWLGDGKETLPRLGRLGRFPRYAPRPYGSTTIELVTSLGIPVRRTNPRLQASAEVTLKVHERLQAGGIDLKYPYIVLNAGSRPGSAKGWRGWAELADVLQGRWQIVIVGGPGEEEALREFQSGQGDLGKVGARLVLDDPVLDLAELAALCASGNVFVTADAGARHIATAAGAKTVVLFGPTDPRHTADQLEHTKSLAHPVPCGPCHLESCDAKEKRACFEGLSAAQVTERVGQLGV